MKDNIKNKKKACRKKYEKPHIEEIKQLERLMVGLS